MHFFQVQLACNLEAAGSISERRTVNRDKETGSSTIRFVWSGGEKGLVVPRLIILEMAERLDNSNGTAIEVPSVSLN